MLRSNLLFFTIASLICVTACRTETETFSAETTLYRGMYVYFADAAWFVDCETDQRLPVAQGARSVDLERAYLAARSAPREPLLVSFHGHIEKRPPMEGPGLFEYVIVDSTVQVHSGHACPDSSMMHSPYALSDRTWHLHHLQGHTASDPIRTITVTFDLENNRVEGFSGCNRFFGGVNLDGAQLSFGMLAGTRAFCAETADLESTFLRTLERVTKHTVYGDTLALYDEEIPVARFTGEPWEDLTE
jgi:copper homeostasis protein (lipoprotein)